MNCSELNLDFDICQVDCNTLLFTDKTCFHKYVNPYCCVDGYNVPGGIDVNDLGVPLFTWVMPGSIITDVDLGYRVGTKARIKVELSSGTTGDVTITLGLINLAIVNFNTSLSQTVDDIVTIINSNSQNTRWQAFRPDTSLNEFIIESMDYGVVNNNKQLVMTINSGDMVFNIGTGLTSGANGFTDEYSFSMDEIYGVQNYSGEIPSGVHTVTYKIFDTNGIEVSRVKKHMLIDYKERNTIKAWILKDKDGSCGCEGKLDERIVELRLLLERARVQFNCGDYKCVNKTITKFNKLAKNICLDC